MIQLKNPQREVELRNSIKRLVQELDKVSTHRSDKLDENNESVASYVARLNDELLNRTFLDYCSAARNYASSKQEI